MRRRFFVLLEGRKPEILEKLVKALFEWLASLWYEMVEYLLDQLMELFNVDLSYFAERVPVIDDIANIFVAVGWALLIGNLAYQAMRSMASGVGIEAEEPGRLFLRSAMFSFLLLVSRQICAIGFDLSATVMEMLQVPDAVTFDPFGEETFDTLPNAGWLIVIVVNIVIQWQLIRLFFEVAERYVILCVLTYCAPLAFAMGGSKSTGDIFRGWLRMFASMCVLMVFNLMFVKLVLSALSTDPNGAAIIPWAMLVVGIVRMAKKMDGIILRIGLNPALTGDPLGARFPGALTAMTLRSIASVVTHTAAKHTPSAGYSNTFGSPPREGPLWGGMGKNGTGGPVSSGRLSDSRKESIRSRTAAEGTAVTRGAGSGMRAAQELEAFRRRYGADNTEKMRQVRGTVSINANDFDDESHISSHVEKNSSAAETISEAGGRVTPPKRPLTADFGRMSPPRTDGRLPPVTPPRAEGGKADCILWQDAPTGKRTVPAPAAGPVDSVPRERRVHGATSVTAASARENDVPMPRQGRTASAPSSMAVGIIPAANAVNTPLTDRPVQGSAAVTVQEQTRATVQLGDALSVPSVSPGGMAQAHRTDKEVSAARIAPARESAPQFVVPRLGSAVTPERQDILVAQQVAARRATHEQGLPAVQPASQRKAPAGSEAAPRGVSADYSGCPPVRPARRESKPGRCSTAVHPDDTPGIRTPDMVTPPPAVQPRTLRRSAQPLKNKAAPETPKGGGPHNRKRRRKK